jgi:Ca2+:H+ antiporter
MPALFALGGRETFIQREVVWGTVASVLVFMISADGRSNWLEGAQLTGAYVIMAVSFFFVEHL